MAVALALGAAAGGSLVAAADAAWPFWGYYSEQVSVPPNASDASPYVVGFHGATFSIWLPYSPPGAISSGLTGPSFSITEPSGMLVQTGTGCGACDASLHTWYSSDGSVGVAWHNGALGSPFLLVRQ